jgi:hypothetical protein
MQTPVLMKQVEITRPDHPACDAWMADRLADVLQTAAFLYFRRLLSDSATI